MFNLILVEKSCRENGLFEIAHDTGSLPGKSFRFFSPHHPVTGTAILKNDTVTVTFKDSTFNGYLLAHMPPSPSITPVNHPDRSWMISDMEGCKAFWENVHQLIQDANPAPFATSKDGHEDDESDFDPAKDGEAKTETERLKKERIGQQLYRKNQEKLWGNACAVTGIKTPELLRASHAKPWGDCTSGKERLDPYNGFLLSVGLDALFDKDLISFSAEGNILINPALSEEDLASIGITKTMRLRQLTLAHKPYLDIQRERFYAKCRGN